LDSQVVEKRGVNIQHIAEIENLGEPSWRVFEPMERRIVA